MDADGLFVYGPLREGGAQHAWLKRTGFEGLCGAWTPGRLFHLGELGTPALVPGAIPEALPPGPGWVFGEFVGYDEAEELEAAVENLDALEGTDEERTERRLLPVLLEGGQIYKAWSWVFPEDRLLRLEREGLELKSGDWRDYL
ncbi:MAG: gamma-glutamylcyclotransferase family protein [Candidatus Dormibacteraceae bacterium]